MDQEKITNDLISDEREIFSVCRSFLIRLGGERLRARQGEFDRSNVDRFLKLLEQDDFDGARRRLHLRRLCKAMMAQSHEAVAFRLDQEKKRYFTKLKKYGWRYGLTATAISEFDVARARYALLDLRASLDPHCEDNLSGHGSWDAAVQTYIRELDSLCELTSRLSEQRLSWQKLLDDKNRLNVALWAFGFGLSTFLASFAYTLWQDCHDPQKQCLKDIFWQPNSEVGGLEEPDSGSQGGDLACQELLSNDQ